MPYTIERPVNVVLRCDCGRFEAIGTEASALKLWEQHVLTGTGCPTNRPCAGCGRAWHGMACSATRMS